MGRRIGCILRSWLCRVRVGCGLAENDVACLPSGPGEAAPGTGPHADGSGRICALNRDRQLRRPYPWETSARSPHERGVNRGLERQLAAGPLRR